MLPRTFLLSPAYCGGKRAELLLNTNATFSLAQKMNEPGGAPIGEVFSFVSGLYFRGKLAYAGGFGRGTTGQASAMIITPTRGLMTPDTRVTREDVAEFAMVDISEQDRRFRDPLARDAAVLASATSGDLVLLGSVATGKYVDILVALLGTRLLFPADFVGRGDMSRGGLMLRSVQSGEELRYIAVEGAVRHGQRPPKLSQRA